MHKTANNKFLQVVIICINMLILLDNIHLFYRYHFSHTLFLFKYPDWFLWTNTILAITGIVTSVLFGKHRMNIKSFLINTLITWSIILFNYL